MLRSVAPMWADWDSSFCQSTIKSKPYFALVATNYPPLLIDTLAQMLTAFGMTSRVS